MKYRSPVITLLAVGAGLAALLVVNSTQASNSPAVQPAPATTPAPSTSPPGTTVTLPSATVPPSTPASPEPSRRGSPTSPAATAPPGFPAKVLYAGRTEDRAASVAIAVLNGRSAAYFCDGRAVEAWLTGTATGGRIELRSKRGDTVRAQLSGTTLTGVATIGDRTYRFTVAPAGPPAGLYRGRAAIQGRSTTIGWIVLSDGSQVGIRTTRSERGAAPTLDRKRLAATVDGTLVRAVPVTGATVF